MVAGLIGVKNIDLGMILSSNDNYRTDFENYIRSLPNQEAVVKVLSAGWTALIIGYKYTDEYSSFCILQYGGGGMFKPFVEVVQGVLTWY